MRIWLMDQPQAVNEADLLRHLQEVSMQRRVYAMKYRQLIDRVLSVEAYRLLCQGLREEYGIDALPELVYSSHGKPLLKDYPSIHFNWSHCRKGVACVLNDSPVGIDIEEVPAVVDEDMIRYCFSKAEQEDIRSAADGPLRFAEWWTRKEAVLKLTGEGLTADLPGLLVPELLQRLQMETFADGMKGWVCTVCTFV